MALPFAILGLLFAATAGLAYYFANQELRLAIRLNEFASQRGWSFRRHPANRRAYQLSGRQGEIAWQLEIYRNARNQLPYTLWESRNASLADGPLLIGQGLALLVAPAGENEAQNKLRSLGANILFRPSGWGMFSLPGVVDPGFDLDGLEVQPAGSPALQEHYDVLGKSAAQARQGLTPRVERLLLEWPASPPLVTADAQGVSIRLPNDLPAEQPELVEGLVNLGLAVCEAVAEPDDLG